MSIHLTTLAMPAQLITCSESDGIDNMLWVGLGWNGQAKKCGYNLCRVDLCAESYAEPITVHIIIVNKLYKYYSVG